MRIRLGSPLDKQLPSFRDRSLLAFMAVLLLILVGLPYLYASFKAPSGFIFNGFLLNPLDGNTYLAKMYLGWRGEWWFTLPYTAEVGRGVFLYPFYILLGQFSRLVNIPLVITFHMARLASTIVLLFALARYLRSIISDRDTLCLALLISTFGSGLGWLAIAFGRVTADFWVAEAYPFLSAYTNPHFPLSLALMLILLTPPTAVTEIDVHASKSWMVNTGWIFLAAFTLACLSPFGLAMTTLVWGGVILWDVLRPRSIRITPAIRNPVQRLVWIVAGGGWVVVYQFYILHKDPLLSGWNLQNVTPAPPVWDTILSLSPLLLLVPIGMGEAIKKENGYLRLLVWLVIGLISLYIPWSLQRRFMVGIYVPVAALASIGLRRLAGGPGRFWLYGIVILALALPTNLAILMATRYATQTHDENIYLTRDEVDALDWISQHTPPNAVILAGPETGLFIPSRTGRRVIYGHPFETVNAAKQRQLVEGFFRGFIPLNSKGLIQRVDFIYDGPRERKIGDPNLGSLPIVYQNPGVTIYALK